MKTTFTVQYIKDNSGCYTSEPGKLKKTFEDNGKTCFDQQSCDVTLQEVLSSNISDKDKYWFVCKNALDKEEVKDLATKVYTLFEETFKSQFPSDAHLIGPYVSVIKQYIAGMASYSDVIDAYRIAYKSASRGVWVLDHVYYAHGCAGMGFGFYWLAGWEPMTKVLSDLVRSYCSTPSASTLSFNITKNGRDLGSFSSIEELKAAAYMYGL